MGTSKNRFSCRLGQAASAADPTKSYCSAGFASLNPPYIFSLMRRLTLFQSRVRFAHRSFIQIRRPHPNPPPLAGEGRGGGSRKNHSNHFVPLGFTLVEMVVVIAITGVIAGMIGIFILRPVQSYDAQVRRAELVDAAESALRRMQRDIRRALPNSVRIRDSAGNVGNADCTVAGGVCVLELLYTVDGGRYRANPPPGAPVNRFQFGINETDFDVLGSLQNFAAVNPATDWLVVNNQTTIGTQFNAYFGDNRGLLSNAATTATHINLAGKNFAATLASPRQRFYIVNTPVTFLCDTNAAVRALTRYSNYPIVVDHTTIDTPGELNAQPGVQPARAAELVSACAFTYQPGSSSRSGLVTIALTLSDPQTSEQVRLLHQVHVDNVP